MHTYTYSSTYVLSFFYIYLVQDLALQSAYHNDRGTYNFIKKIMALPFFPEAEIQPIFQRLQREATEPLLQSLSSDHTRTATRVNLLKRACARELSRPKYNTVGIISLSSKNVFKKFGRNFKPRVEDTVQ